MSAIQHPSYPSLVQDAYSGDSHLPFRRRYVLRLPSGELVSLTIHVDHEDAAEPPGKWTDIQAPIEPTIRFRLEA